MRALTIAVLALLLALPAAAQNKVVIATGRADGVDTAARDRAIQDAQRKALEKAFGTFIHSQSETENYELVRDKIFAETRGMVDSYKIISEKKEGGLTVITISASVSEAKFRGRWEAIRQMVHRKKRPRMMFLIYELHPNRTAVSPGVDGFQTSTANRFASRLEEMFGDNKFFIVDRRQVLKIKAGDMKAAKLQADLSMLAKLAKDQNCEVVVFGHIRGFPGGTKTMEVAGVRSTFHYFNFEVTAKAVRADTGKVVTSLSREFAGRSNRGTAGARSKAMQETVKGYGELLMEKILSSWNNDLTNMGNVKLTVSNISFMQVAKLQNALRKLRWTGQVSARSYAAKVQEWDIETRLSAQDFAMKLATTELPVPLEVTGVNQNKILAKIGK